MSEKSTVLKQINLAKENNQNAFSFLLNFYWDDVYKFQLKRTNNEIDAEDITIESFAKAFEKINTYNHKYVFKTWLITISKNLHIDQLRKNKNKFDLNQLNENTQIKESSPSPEDNLINEQKLKSLKSKINKHKTVIITAHVVMLDEIPNSSIASPAVTIVTAVWIVNIVMIDNMK